MSNVAKTDENRNIHNLKVNDEFQDSLWRSIDGSTISPYVDVFVFSHDQLEKMSTWQLAQALTTIDTDYFFGGDVNSLRIPESENITVDRKTYSLQAIGKLLPIFNATKYGEAINRVRASEQPGYSYAEADNITRGAQIAKVGRGALVLGLFEKEKTHISGSPDSLMGYIQTNLVRVRDCLDDLSALGTRYVQPQISDGPRISRELDLPEGTRYKIKLELMRFAFKSFMNEKGNIPFTGGIIVEGNDADLASKRIFTELGLETAYSMKSYKKGFKWQKPHTVEHLRFPFAMQEKLNTLLPIAEEL